MERILVPEVKRLAVRPLGLDILDIAKIFLRAEMNFGRLCRRCADGEDGNQTDQRGSAFDEARMLGPPNPGRASPGIKRSVPHSHGISEAWITSGTPPGLLPTERMARSTSLRPKRWVVIFSSGKRLEAICCKASSQAL